LSSDTMHRPRLTAFGLNYKPETCVWWAQVRKNGITHVICVVGYLRRTIYSVSHAVIFILISLTDFSDQIRSTVTDGLTIRRPCCSVQDCSEPLPHVKKCYCHLHNYLDSQCAVTKCTAIAEQDFRTCNDPEHRKLETYYFQQGKAMFQLKHRLERAKISQTHNSLSSSTGSSHDESTAEDNMPDLVAPDDGDEDEDIGEGAGVQGDDEDTVIDEDGVCDGKSDTGNKSVRARFGRRRTHNEELCVGSCGVILGRATFYGSEAPNGVRVRFSPLSKINSAHCIKPSNRLCG